MTRNPELGLAIVAEYNPETSEVTLIPREGGAALRNVVYRPNLHVMETPVVTDLRPGIYNPLKTGSLVLYGKFSEAEVRILCIVEDDSSIVQPRHGSSKQFQQGKVEDAFARMAQDGETLVSAPGVLDPDTKMRVPGAWSHYRKDGTLVASNADASANLTLGGTGSVILNSTDVMIAGIGSNIQLDAQGNLAISCDKYGQLASRIIMTAGSGTSFDPSLLAEVPGASVSLKTDNAKLQGTNVAVSGGASLALSGAETRLDCTTCDVSATGVATIQCANGARIEVARTGVYITLPNDKDNKPLPLVINGVDSSLEMGNVLCVEEGATEVTSLDEIKVTKHVLVPIQNT